MEKLIYPLWKPDTQTGDDFRDALLATGSALEGESTLRAARLAVADGDVAAGEHRRMAATHPLPDAVLSLWVDRADGRGPLEALFAPAVQRFHCYLVTEAEPLVNTRHPAAPGERVHGMCHVVFLQRPPRLSEAQWLDIWLGRHTPVAIETQSTFGYRQNVIVRGLSYAAPPVHAMIEENFPPEAMTSDFAFYGVEEGDQEGLARHSGAMMESVARFIDFDRIDVIPMSEYLLKSF
jgi:hypothetical protein